MKLKKLFLMSSLLILFNISTVKAEHITYVVKTGDSLWKISKAYSTTVNSILKLNNLSESDYIYPGQKLTIETYNTQNLITYTVKHGDTLWKISKFYNSSIDSLVSLNNISELNYIYPGQKLLVQPTIHIVNYSVKSNDNLWSIAQEYNTTMNAILESNMLSSSTIMPGQILTIPVNSTSIVKPIGITMYAKRQSDSYGDIYTWENARRLFTVDTKGTLKDIETGIWFNIKYYGGSNHADIVPLTKNDTNKMKTIFPTWSWEYKRPMILYFSQGNINYQLAVSVTGMPHSTTNIYDNGVNGHFDLYFYNSTSHVNNTKDSIHQANILKANGK